MKIIIKTFSIVFLLIALLLGLITVANSGALDKQIKLGLLYYSNLKGIKTKFYDLKFKNGKLTISTLNIQVGSCVTKINNIELQTSFSLNQGISAKLNPLTISMIKGSSQPFVNATISGLIELNLSGIQKTQIDMQDINIYGILDVDNNSLEGGFASINYDRTSGQGNLDSNINFGKLVKLNISTSKENSKNTNLHAENIPIVLYKIANEIFPANGLLDFLNYSIQDGHIKNANIQFDLNASELSKKNLSGSVKIQKLNYKYDDQFPMLKDMDIDILMSGKKTKFIVNSAYSSDILLSDGVIDMDWRGLDDTVLYINAIGKGPTKGLTDFITQEQHESMAQANINLRKIKGKVDTTIYIEAPLKPKSKNLYDIKAEIPNASLNVFQNHVKLTRTKILASFDGSQVKLHGVGKLNGFNADLDFIYNIEDESEFNHKLDIKTHFKTKSSKTNRNQKIAFISLLDGSSILDIKYVNKDSKGYITVDSDISELELYFDKLGIRKGKNVPARIKINGLFDNPTSGVIDFNTYSDNGLSILGDVKISDSEALVNFEEIKNKETNISGTVHITKEIIIAKLKGKTLDLSDADMIQFLEKERDSGNSRLNIDIDRVKLKDNIWLDDLKLMFECDSTRCFAGYIDSKINSRDIEMLITAKDDREDWLNKCNDAGAFLKGIGAYDSMKSGKMLLKISTSRKEVRPGEIIPILDGTFTFERFKLQDTPAITRLVSFVSLPGFFSLISGNKDIWFSGMSGNFSFKNNMLKIDNGFATGPYFDFSIKGNVDIRNRYLDIKGHVNPALYGVSAVIGAIPIIGRIFTGNKKHRGLVSGTYKIQDKY
jgi:hypothetical protein